MAQQLIELHASGLSELGDCARRGAAKIMKGEIGKIYGFGETRKGIGAAMGTTLHSMMAQLFRIKLQLGVLDESHIEDALQEIWPKFETEISGNIIWETKGPTPHIDTARTQLRNMALALLPVARFVDPYRIEHDYELDINRLGDYALPVLLKGRPDVISTRGEVHDHKCGKTFPSAHAQIGLYIILAREHGDRADYAVVNWVPRKGIRSQDEIICRSVKLPAEECVAAAYSAIEEFQRHYMRWLESKERGVLDPWAFPANPVSYLCSGAYCLAYETGFCGVGAQPGETNGSTNQAE